MPARSDFPGAMAARAPLTKQARIAAGLLQVWCALFVAIDLFTTLVQFLGFQAQRRNGSRIEARQTDRIASLLAIAVAAVFQPLQRRINFGNQLALTIARPQFQ